MNRTARVFAGISMLLVAALVAISVLAGAVYLATRADLDHTKIVSFAQAWTITAGLIGCLLAVLALCAGCGWMIVEGIKLLTEKTKIEGGQK